MSFIHSNLEPLSHFFLDEIERQEEGETWGKGGGGGTGGWADSRCWGRGFVGGEGWDPLPSKAWAEKQGCGARRVLQTEWGAYPQRLFPLLPLYHHFSPFDTFLLERTAKWQNSIKGRQFYPMSCHPEAASVSVGAFPLQSFSPLSLFF